MRRIFKTEDGKMHEKFDLQPGCWIALTNPTASEIMEIADAYQIDPDHIKAPLDEEERSRIEVEDEYTLILVDIPSIEERNGKDWFVTIPLAIITNKDVLITVCLEDNPILTSFMDGRVRDFHTFMKTRFILQILYRNTAFHPGTSFPDRHSFRAMSWRSETHLAISVPCCRYFPISSLVIRGGFFW